MQSNSPFTPRPLQSQGRDWNNAPKIVKYGAYPLTWYGMFMSLLSLVLVGLTFLKQRVAVQSGQAVGGPNAEGGPNVEGIVFLVFLVTFLAVNAWLNRGLLSGKAAAWMTQLVFSTLAFALSLLNITSPRFNPILPIIIIAIHGFILSQWFKPETKAWFGKS